MSGNDDKVLLDLNYPAFQNELFDLDATEIKKVTKTLRKIKVSPGTNYSETTA